MSFVMFMQEIIFENCSEEMALLGTRDPVSVWYNDNLKYLKIMSSDE
jgi:hypothetical protein